MVREPDATMQPSPQDNQLMSKRRVLSFKPQLRLEWRGQDSQSETEQPDHSASLGDSITSSTRIRFSVHTGIGLAQAERTNWGGTVGTGFEYGFAPNWSVGIEYDFLFRVSDSNTFLTPGLAPITAITANTRSDVNMITARINYRFGWGSAPIVSKY
jgi:opacity protein-like surface antigen